VLNFKISGDKMKNWMHFVPQNNLQIFMILMNFVKFWSVNAYKKLWLRIFGIFICCKKKYEEPCIINQGFLKYKKNFKYL